MLLVWCRQNKTQNLTHKTCPCVKLELTSLPLCEQVLRVWSLRKEPPSTQVPWSSHGRMSCAVTHRQPASLCRETTRTHQRQTALNQTTHNIHAATSGARQPNHILVSPLAVRVYSTLVSNMFLNKEVMNVNICVFCFSIKTHVYYVLRCFPVCAIEKC